MRIHVFESVHVKLDGCITVSVFLIELIFYAFRNVVMLDEKCVCLFVLFAWQVLFVLCWYISI